MIKCLAIIGGIGGAEFFSQTILMALQNLTKDTQWRVRMAVVQVTTDLAKQFGRDFYQKNLDPIFVSFLNDTAASVRNEGRERLKILATEFKSDWVINQFLPKLVENIGREKQGYLYRIASISCMTVMPLRLLMKQSVLHVLSKDQIGSSLIPILVKSSKDPIPNVRFCVCKILTTIIPSLDSNLVHSRIKPYSITVSYSIQLSQ